MKNQLGQTLIEVLVALGAAVIVLSAITVIVVTSLNNAQFGKNQNSASQYAQQGIEIIRKQRDRAWNTFNALDGSYCLDKGDITIEELDKKGSIPNGCAKVGSTNPLNVDNFAREVVIEPADSSEDCSLPTPVAGVPNPTLVTVIVSWGDSKCTDSNNLFCHQAKAVSCFSNFTVIPTP